MAELVLMAKNTCAKSKKQELSPVLEQLKEGLEDLRAGRVDEV